MLTFFLWCRTHFSVDIEPGICQTVTSILNARHVKKKKKLKKIGLKGLNLLIF